MPVVRLARMIQTSPPAAAPKVVHTEHIGIRVRDMEASLAFYHGTLGLAIAERRTMPSGNEIVFLELGSAGYVELISRAAPGFTPAQPVPGGQAGLQHFAIQVEDLDVWLAHIKAHEVPLTVQPFAFELTAHRCRAFFVADPDGTPVELFERRPK